MSPGVPRVHGGRDVWRRAPGPRPRRPWDAAQSPLATARLRERAWDGAGGLSWQPQRRQCSQWDRAWPVGWPFATPAREGRTALAPCELPTAFAMAPVPANRWPDTASLHGSFTVQDGSWGRAPGWGLGRASQTRLDNHSLQCAWMSTAQEPYQDIQVALSVLAQGHILAEPLSHSTSCMHG